MEEQNVIIVIDPGHGGENLGAEYESFVEKEMTLKVAKRMRDILNQYDGIDVYLTRTGDQDIELDERALFAAEKNADFIFCLHFNMSVNHDLYGAETWISAFGEQYARGNDFAKIEMEMLTDLGLFDRGVKTKLASRRNEDYYGIIRHATENKIPCVLIEHCHLDNVRDYPFYHENTDEWLNIFAEIDATAVAKYYHLKSESLGEDFSDFTYEKTAVPKRVVKPDSTDPEESILTLEKVDQETGTATVHLKGHDSDCRLIYYTYSFDGGKTVSERFPWNDGKEEVTFEIPLPEEDMQVCAVVYNLFDRRTVSNPVELPALEVKEVLSTDIVIEQETAAVGTMQNGSSEEEPSETMQEVGTEEQPTGTKPDTILDAQQTNTKLEAISETQPTEIKAVIDYDTYEEIKIPPIQAQEQAGVEGVLYFSLLSALLLVVLLSAFLTARYVIRSGRRKRRKRRELIE